MAFKWLEKLTQLRESASEKGNDRDELGMTLAVLMLEVAKSDFEESEAEIQTLTAWLENQDLGLKSQDVGQLLDSARNEQAGSAGLFEYTRRACERMSMEERVELVEQLWRIAYADGVIDKYEEAAIRKASELLYVSHSDFIRAKFAAKAASQREAD
ncbi:MAG: TerB family tellurite resistance protein [Pseudomonadota bacterium]|nr:TerB family tellurite resistance protein [Pseudomonadota bacterium]MEC8003506.1 TerB family tellurite resistance protein [Pseudomonadota bacterium]